MDPGNFYRIRFADGTETGSLDLHAIEPFVKEGRVRATTMIFIESENKWRLAASVPEVRLLIRKFNEGQDSTLDKIRPPEGGQTTRIKAWRGSFLRKIFRS